MTPDEIDTAVAQQKAKVDRFIHARKKLHEMYDGEDWFTGVGMECNYEERGVVAASIRSNSPLEELKIEIPEEIHGVPVIFVWGDISAAKAE